jgi:hypothetical protein
VEIRVINKYPCFPRLGIGCDGISNFVLVDNGIGIYCFMFLFALMVNTPFCLESKRLLTKKYLGFSW